MIYSLIIFLILLPMKIFLTNERLILREILPTDVEGMYELDSDPEVHKYLGNHPVKTKAESLELINYIRQQYVEHGIGRWAIIDRKTNKFIGWTGLKYVTKETNHHRNYYDLGYRLIKRFWGRGIASETAFAILDYAFNTLNLSEVFAMAASDNLASNRILQNVGLQLKETFDMEGVSHNWYEIKNSEYWSKFGVK